MNEQTNDTTGNANAKGAYEKAKDAAETASKATGNWLSRNKTNILAIVIGAALGAVGHRQYEKRRTA